MVFCLLLMGLACIGQEHKRKNVKEEFSDIKNYVLVGRPNVGKSSLFNFLIKKHEAFVKDDDGTTQDWRSKKVGNIVFWDTPGVFKLGSMPPVKIDKVFLVVENNILNYDKQIYLALKKKYDVYVIVNKIDLGADDYSFFSPYIEISLKQRIGFEQLKKLFDYNNEPKDIIDSKKKIWAIMGKPNVGKSSITNMLAKKDIHKVEDFDGTTKEFLPVELDEKIVLDTPGQRNNAVFPKYRNIFGILFVIDLKAQRQDLKMIGLMHDGRKPIIVVINKIDLAKGNEIKEIEEKIKKFWDVSIIKISCAKNINVAQINKLIDIQEENYSKRITTSALNDWLRKEVVLVESRLKFMTQIETNPPKFYLDHKLTDDKERMLKRRLARKFGFEGVPILFQYKQKEAF